MSIHLLKLFLYIVCVHNLAYKNNFLSLIITFPSINSIFCDIISLRIYFFSMIVRQCYYIKGMHKKAVIDKPNIGILLSLFAFYFLFKTTMNSIQPKNYQHVVRFRRDTKKYHNTVKLKKLLTSTRLNFATQQLNKRLKLVKHFTTWNREIINQIMQNLYSFQINNDINKSINNQIQTFDNLDLESIEKASSP